MSCPQRFGGDSGAESTRVPRRGRKIDWMNEEFDKLSPPLQVIVKAKKKRGGGGGGGRRERREKERERERERERGGKKEAS